MYEGYIYPEVICGDTKCTYSMVIGKIISRLMQLHNNHLCNITIGLCHHWGRLLSLLYNHIHNTTTIHSYVACDTTELYM